MTVAAKMEVMPLMIEMITASCSQLLLKEKCVFICSTADVLVSFNHAGLNKMTNLLHRVIAGEGNETTKSQREGIKNLSTRIQPR